LRGVLLDKDGTLIDFRSTWVPAYRGIAAELAGHLGGGPELEQRLLRWVGYDPFRDEFAPDTVVGDTPADLIMARDAGCAMVVAVATGAIPLSQLAERASHVLPSVQEIETLL
jgi:phosphoglycolate phosphatase